MFLQDCFKRRSGVWPRGHGGIILIRPERRYFAPADRCEDRGGVEWIAPWTPHGLPCPFFVKYQNQTAACLSISVILIE
jgi:hypothetical protein